MKIFTAALMHETLSPETYETTKQDFEDAYLVYHGQHTSRDNSWIAPVYLWQQLAAQHNCELIEGLCALTNPSGTVAKAAFEEFQQQILEDLTAALPVDGILLNLHGAMVANGYDDCEGELLKNIRAIAGNDVPIGVLMDLHAHHTAQKEQFADAILYYHEYPHIDLKERAFELFHLLFKTMQRQTKPAVSSFYTQMLSHILTTREPMRSIVDTMQKLIDPAKGIELVSIAHGFPWSDVPHTGVTPVVVYNAAISGAKPYAQRISEAIGLILYALRDETKPQTVTLTKALAIKSSRPLVLADYADNPGGGALGCSTFIMKELLSRQIPRAAISAIRDEKAIALIFGKSYEDELTIELGGDPQQAHFYGNPLRVKVKIMALLENFQDEFAGGSGIKGRAARLQVLEYFDGQQWLPQEDVDIVIKTSKDQTFSPKSFTAFGIDPQQKQILVVKSMYHYRAAFRNITAEENLLTLSMEGRLTPDFSKIPYQKLPAASLWPIMPTLPKLEALLAKRRAEPESLFNKLWESINKPELSDKALSSAAFI